jgi:hypothetical protein
MPAERRPGPPLALSAALGAAVVAAAVVGAVAWTLSRPAPAPAGDAPAPPASSAAAPSEREQMLAEEAAHYAQLRTERDAARSLAAADEGQQSFPRGQLYADREVIAIRALLRLGRTEEGERRGQRFLTRLPNTPQAELVRRMLAPTSGR